MILSDNVKYLKKEEIKSGDKIIIKTEGEFVKSKKFTYPDGTPRDQFQITIELSSGEERTLVLNKTSRNNLKSAWGRETKDWIDRFAVISLVDIMVGGDIKKSIVLLPEIEQHEEPDMVLEDE